MTFGSGKSFLKAVQAGFMEIKTSKFTKKVGRSLSVSSGSVSSGSVSSGGVSSGGVIQ